VRPDGTVVNTACVSVSAASRDGCCAGTRSVWPTGTIERDPMPFTARNVSTDMP